MPADGFDLLCKAVIAVDGCADPQEAHLVALRVAAAERQLHRARARFIGQSAGVGANLHRGKLRRQCARRPAQQVKARIIRVRHVERGVLVEMVLPSLGVVSRGLRDWCGRGGVVEKLGLVGNAVQARRHGPEAGKFGQRLADA